MTLLRTVNLKKYFGDTHAVDGVDFTVLSKVTGLFGKAS